MKFPDQIAQRAPSPDENQGGTEKKNLKETPLDKIRSNHPEIFALISKTYNPDSPLKVNENGQIETEEGEYLNIPRMQELVRITAAIKEKLSPIPEGYVRLWRGNREKEVGKNPSYTNSLTGIALPFLLSYKGPLSYVDVRKELSEKCLSIDGVAPGAEFILPTESLSGIQVVGLTEEEKNALIEESLPEDRSKETDGWGKITI